jgi:hypothetical protein
VPLFIHWVFLYSKQGVTNAKCNVTCRHTLPYPVRRKQVENTTESIYNSATSAEYNSSPTPLQNEVLEEQQREGLVDQ